MNANEANAKETFLIYANEAKEGNLIGNLWLETIHHIHGGRITSINFIKKYVIVRYPFGK
jgi:hypothetical protein